MTNNFRKKEWYVWENNWVRFLRLARELNCGLEELQENWNLSIFRAMEADDSFDQTS